VGSGSSLHDRQLGQVSFERRVLLRAFWRRLAWLEFPFSSRYLAYHFSFALRPDSRTTATTPTSPTAAVRESIFLRQRFMKLPWASTCCSHIPLFPLLDGHLSAFLSHISTSISGIAFGQLCFSSILYIFFEPVWGTTGFLARTQAVSLVSAGHGPALYIPKVDFDQGAPDANQTSKAGFGGLELALRHSRSPAQSALRILITTHNQSLQCEVGMQSCA
jgi:hypothetical protein